MTVDFACHRLCVTLTFDCSLISPDLDQSSTYLLSKSVLIPNFSSAKGSAKV